ncbi:MAG: SDR family oxidoreductase [Candidatus Helarchaeota archaeon]|nr:SDR family oxidoreductase [Candidatus Helarchaeota archaeon]
MSLEGKVAIVTGGGRGIGRAIALDFAKNGADVVVAARTESEIENVAEEIRKLDRQSLAIRTDMIEEESIKNLISITFEKFKKIDILVNNAGLSGASPIASMKTEEWDRIINVNLRGVMIATREVLKFMKKQKSGYIISIASGFGIEGQPFLSAYGVTKAGVILFNEVLAKEVKYIKAYVINPGLIDTKLARLSTGKKEPPEIIGPIASYLASDENKLPSGIVVKRIQLDNMKAAISPLIQGRTYPDWKTLFKEIKPQLSEKILRNIKKYNKMMPFLFRDFLKQTK